MFWEFFWGDFFLIFPTKTRNSECSLMNSFSRNKKFKGPLGLYGHVWPPPKLLLVPLFSDFIIDWALAYFLICPISLCQLPEFFRLGTLSMPFPWGIKTIWLLPKWDPRQHFLRARPYCARTKGSYMALEGKGYPPMATAPPPPRPPTTDGHPRRFVASWE
jgi:hypothetical protein